MVSFATNLRRQSRFSPSFFAFPYKVYKRPKELPSKPLHISLKNFLKNPATMAGKTHTFSVTAYLKLSSPQKKVPCQKSQSHSAMKFREQIHKPLPLNRDCDTYSTITEEFIPKIWSQCMHRLTHFHTLNHFRLARKTRLILS